jgi:hypothetical protein
VDSSAGDAASFSATAAGGSSPSQDRSVDFLQSTQAGCQSSMTTTSSTTREDSTLTGLTGLPSRSGRRGCWRCLPVPPRQAPPPAPLLPLPLQQQWRAPRPPEQQGLALHLRQEFFDSGGWATTPSGLPHRVPLAFIALINGLRRRQLLQARKPLHQQVNSRHQYSTTLLGMAYLLGHGLCDLQLFGHTFAGRVAWPPWRRGQASRRILNERHMR